MSYEFFVLATMDSSLRLLALSQVREIVPAMALTRPLTTYGSCIGLLNLRGETIPVFSTGQRVDDVQKLILILRSDAEQSIGLLVDDVLDVLSLRADELREQPIGQGRYARIAQVKGEPLVVLTPGDILDAA